MTSRALKRAMRAAAFAVLPSLVAVQAVAAAGPPAPKATADVLATTSNPYAGCTIGSGGPGTINYLNAEVEPAVAVDPADTANVIGVVQQDRWNDGGAHGNVAMVSHTGGRSFHVVPLPFTECSSGGLHYQRASDPWVSFGPDGTAYAIGLVFDETTPRNGIAAATSTDGGETWHNIQTIDKQTQFVDDKETVTADPMTPGTAYAVWDRSPNCCGKPEPSFFSKTTDYGATWSTPLQMTPTNHNFGEIGNEIVVNPLNGTLYDFFYRFYRHKRNQYMVISSPDGGTSWSQPTVIADDEGILVRDPHKHGKVVRTAAQAIGQAAIDPATGRLYFVWEDARFSGGAHNAAALSVSADGSTWSSPRRVSTNTGEAAFLPTVAVNALGQVAVTYYDFRDYQASDPSLPTGYWMRISPPGGNNFGPDIALRAKPFDMLTAPFAEGYFVGDYEGLAGRGNSFVALFCATTGQPSNPTDCYGKVVNPNPGSTP